MKNMLERFIKDKDFIEFIETYNMQLKRMNHKEIDTNDSELMKFLQDFFNKEMPENILGYIKEMNRIYWEE